MRSFEKMTSVDSIEATETKGDPGDVMTFDTGKRGPSPWMVSLENQSAPFEIPKMRFLWMVWCVKHGGWQRFTVRSLGSARSGGCTRVPESEARIDMFIGPW